MYQHGKRTRQPRNVAVFLATIMIVGVVVLIAWYIVHKDIGSGTAPKTNVPIVTEIGADNGNKIQINENLFSFELPSDWKLLEHRTGNKLNAYVYTSTKKGADDRTLAVHVDVMPESYKLVKMQPLISNGAKFLLGNLSDDCINFAGATRGGQPAQGNAPVQAKWENVTFVCDPIKANQTIGTGTPGSTIGTALGRHTYFFYYEDHNIHPDSKILRDALQSFQAK